MNERVAVMLSETGAVPRVADDFARRDARVDCYTRLEELFEENAPDAIPVLIVHVRERPSGRLLEVIGRLAIEHQRVQVVAVCESTLTLEVAEYLAGRGVELIEVEPPEPETGRAGDLLEVVRKMHERRRLSLACC